MVGRPVRKIALLVSIALLGAMSPRSTVATQTVPLQRVAQMPAEVRLRKLHLVRPDLIPYPLFLEIYC